MYSDCRATQQIIACGAYHFSSTPCMRMLPTHSCLLASVFLTWAALSQPQSCLGCSTRDNVSSLWLRGATAPCFSFLDCFVPPWRPFYPGQLEPTLVSSNPPPPFAPVSPGLLLCGSLSYSLPPNLSCSPLLFLSCCSSLFLSHCALPSLSLSLSVSLSLSPAPKKGVRVVRCISIPPGVRTILHRTEEVWCIH